MTLYFTPDFILPGATTTEEWWSIEGVSLHQYGWNVTTVGGDRYALPPMRGDNLQLSYRPGRVHRPKVADQRTMSLVMWVDANVPDTGAIPTDPLTRLNDSLEFLHKLIWRAQGEQVTLTRRTKLTRGGVPAIVEASALVEVFGDTMAPTMTGRYKADFVMPLVMADPFFYGDQVTVDPIDNNSTVTVVNPGHDVSAFGGLEVDFVGPLAGPILKNLSRSPNVLVHFDQYIDAGVTITLNIGDFTAIENSVAHPGRNWIANVKHSGARNWLGLWPGTNQLHLVESAVSAGAPTPADPGGGIVHVDGGLTPGTGTGHAVVRYSPIYL